jgi:hypothetical protein
MIYFKRRRRWLDGGVAGVCSVDHQHALPHHYMSALFSSGFILQRCAMA